MQTSQEYFTTKVYAKFGGQTECIMDNLKIENDWFLDFTLSEQNEPQAATPVLKRMYASKRQKNKLISEKCVLKYFL